MWIHSVTRIRHDKNIHSLSEHTFTEKVAFNSSLYSDTKKVTNFYTEKM